MTPQDELKFLRPAFKNLFEDESPDVFRFLRLVADVLDTAAGYGPGRCSGSLSGGGCGKTVTFQTAQDDRGPFGWKCPECGAVYEWAFHKGPKQSPRRIVITDKGGSHIGHVESLSDSGVFICDDGTVRMP
jgi:hypothetical protein